MANRRIDAIPGDMTLHWTYWPEEERGFVIENPKQETQFLDHFLDDVAESRHYGVKLLPDAASCPPAAEYSGNHQHTFKVVCWHGWILRIDADNGRYVYRIGDYLPDVNRWAAKATHMLKVEDWRDNWICRHIWACRKRAAVVGKWTGTRVLHRRDLTGIEWTIQRMREGVNGGPIYTLTMTYREHRLISSHFSVDAAKAHVEEMLESWTARSLADWASGR